MKIRASFFFRVGAILSTITALASTPLRANDGMRYDSRSGAQFASPTNAVPRFLDYDGRYASAPQSMPYAVRNAVAAANRLQGKPYVWGGGHKFLEDRGYDCSGSVSYVLFNAGLIRGPLTSRNYMSFGEPGPGRYITLYVKSDHVFIAICGLRFDTSDHGAGRGDGPRWRPVSRDFSGFQVRHPVGL